MKTITTMSAKTPSTITLNACITKVQKLRKNEGEGVKVFKEDRQR